MSVVDKALETQIRNIQARTGKTLDQLHGVIRASGLTRHGEIRDMLKRDLGMGHGDANTLVHTYAQSSAPAAATGTAPAGVVLDEIYSGAKAHLGPIHDRLLAAIERFGPFEIAPKKGYVSLRRKKQFATIGPATKTRVEVGLNMKGVEATTRLIALPSGGMCQYKVHVTAAEDANPELVAWIRHAYDSAG